MPKTSSGLIVPLNAMREEAVDPGPPVAPFVKQINAELQKLDPYLELVWIGPNAARGVIPGVEPGRWHVRRTPPGIIHSYWPIMGPDKEYAEPTMKLIEPEPVTSSRYRRYRLTVVPTVLRSAVGELDTVVNVTRSDQELLSDECCTLSTALENPLKAVTCR